MERPTVQAIDLNALVDTLASEVHRAVRLELSKNKDRAKKELLTVEEAAEEFGMSPGYWRKQILHRAVPHVKMGKSVRLRRKDLEAFIDENVVRETA